MNVDGRRARRCCRGGCGILSGLLRGEVRREVCGEARSAPSGAPSAADGAAGPSEAPDLGVAKPVESSRDEMVKNAGEPEELVVEADGSAELKYELLGSWRRTQQHCGGAEQTVGVAARPHTDAASAGAVADRAASGSDAVGEGAVTARPAQPLCRGDRCEFVSRERQLAARCDRRVACVAPPRGPPTRRPRRDWRRRPAPRQRGQRSPCGATGRAAELGERATSFRVGDAPRIRSSSPCRSSSTAATPAQRRRVCRHRRSRSPAARRGAQLRSERGERRAARPPRA